MTSNFWTKWSLMLTFCICMSHEHSSPGIEGQGHRLRSKVNMVGRTTREGRSTVVYNRSRNLVFKHHWRQKISFDEFTVKRGDEIWTFLEQKLELERQFCHIITHSFVTGLFVKSLKWRMWTEINCRSDRKAHLLTHKQISRLYRRHSNQPSSSVENR